MHQVFTFIAVPQGLYFSSEVFKRYNLIIKHNSSENILLVITSQDFSDDGDDELRAAFLQKNTEGQGKVSSTCTRQGLNFLNIFINIMNNGIVTI